MALMIWPMARTISGATPAENSSPKKVQYERRENQHQYENRCANRKVHVADVSRDFFHAFHILFREKRAKHWGRDTAYRKLSKCD